MIERRQFPVVIWFIGISGAGKSALAGRLRHFFEAQGIRNCLIDGDEVREFFDYDLGYSKADRTANIKRILFAAHLLAQSGVAAIVANISPFEGLRAFARRKIPRYHEIHLKKELVRSIEADVKQVYQRHRGRGELVGIEIPFEEPRASHLTLEVDRHSEESCFEAVLDSLQSRYPEAGL